MSAIQKKIHDSLYLSWKEGIAAQVMLSLMDYYLIPYGLFLGASTQQTGWLAAIPHLLASVSQLFAVRVVRLAGSRLRFLVQGTFIQSVLLVPLALLAFLPSPRRIETLIVLTAAFRITGNLIGTAWGSLMSDYLPPEKRGHYFGWRSQIIGITGVLTMFFAGLLLFALTKIYQPFGFLLLFLIAAICRLISTGLMSRMADLPLHQTPDSEFTFLMFVQRLKESNFVKYVLYIAAITFAAHLSAPYLTVFMLRELHFSYLAYMLVFLGPILTGLIAFPIWGKHADVVGNAKILKITSFLIPLTPMMWLFSTHPLYLMLVEMFAGFVWGGFNLCATNYIYDAVSPPKRVRCLAYANLINGVAIFGGASLGAYLADHLPPLWGSRFYSLFLIAGITRFGAHFLLSPHFQEVRSTTKKVSSTRLFFSVVGIRPLAGLTREWNVLPAIKPSLFSLPRVSNPREKD